MTKLKKIYHYLDDTMYLPLLFILLFVLSFCFEDITTLFAGYGKIMVSSSILLTDYFAVGGMGATFFNAATVLLFNLILLHILKIKY